MGRCDHALQMIEQVVVARRMPQRPIARSGSCCVYYTDGHSLRRHRLMLPVCSLTEALRAAASLGLAEGERLVAIDLHPSGRRPSGRLFLSGRILNQDELEERAREDSDDRELEQALQGVVWALRQSWQSSIRVVETGYGSELWLVLDGDEILDAHLYRDRLSEQERDMLAQAIWSDRLRADLRPSL